MASTIFDLKMLKAFYANLPARVDAAKAKLKRPLTLSEKILFAHLHPDNPLADYKRGGDYVFFQVDRVAMQDATAQMALLQFMTCGRKKVAVPSTVHCDHLITAEVGAVKDMVVAWTKTKKCLTFSARFLKNMASGSGNLARASFTKSYSKITPSLAA